MPDKFVLQLESWKDFFSDPKTDELWREEYKETLAVHELRLEYGPDISTYSLMADAGFLFVLSVRDEETRELYGYVIGVTRRHLHHPIVCGFVDTYYLTPSVRKGSLGLRLIREALKEFRQRGAKRVYWTANEGTTTQPLFEALNMKKLSSSYGIWLED